MNLLVSLILCFAIQCLAVIPPKLCPVSSEKRFGLNSDYRYPVDVFNADRRNEVPVVPCFAQRLAYRHNYSCPISYLGCPLIEENVYDGLEKSWSWKKSTSLCVFKNKLHDSSAVINVVVFGGSVTWGRLTNGCNSNDSISESRRAWSHYLEPWLKSTYPAIFKVHNVAVGGATSDYSALRVGGILYSLGLKNLTSSTIIIIDHSFNDYGCKPYKIKETQNGLELLIRRLLSSAQSMTDLPTIILMDMVFPNNDCHSLIYAELASHYSIRLYSYVDAMHSNASMTKQRHFHSNLTNYPIEDNNHPDWITHLAYADFFSSVLQYEIDNCDSKFALDGASTEHYLLPELLFNSTGYERSDCNPEFEPLLRFSFEDIQKNTTIGMYMRLAC